MTGLEILALLGLLGSGFGGSSPSDGPSPAPTPSPGKPKPKPTPVKPPGPKVPVIPASAPAVAKPWPVAVPKDLPKYSEKPEAWEPYIPPPPPVVARATALIRTLWSKGKPGVSTLEQTNGVWVTYVGFVPSKGKRGVAAYRLRAGAIPEGLAAA